MLRNRDDSSLPPARVAEVAESQREWFGRPLKDLFGDICDLCGLTQAQLGDRLGISAPMVSQLMTGRREKPGNPLVQERVIAVGKALEDYEAGRLDPVGLREVVDTLGVLAPGPARSSVVQRTAGAADPMAYAQFLRNLLSTVASANELEGAARLLAKKYPELAELLLVHGTGRTSEAVAHLQRHGFA